MATSALPISAVSGTSKKPSGSVTFPSAIPEVQFNSGTIKDVSDIVSKTVFIKVRFGALGTSRTISSSEVIQSDANAEYLKVQKTLLDSEELDAIRKADGKMRTWLYNTCLPYDMGIMLLPIGLLELAQNKMVEYKEQRAELVEAFIEAYPSLCEQATQNLGSLYDAGDYPSIETIRGKFTFDWQYISFGVPGQLKGISAALFEAEQEKAAERMQAATEEITALMRQTLLELITHLHEKLTPNEEGRPRILRETAVTNVMEFLKNFELRNVTNDFELAEQVEQAKKLLHGANAGTLRNSDLLREKIRSGMDGIKSALSELVENKPGRKFRTLE